MNRTIFIFIMICFFSLSSIIFAEEISITVLDFEVQSEDASHKYLGKGFAEFISVELSSVSDITLIEREKRNEIIEEMKFSLSGLTDKDQLMDMGRLLLSNYLITGTIYNMAGNLAVTGRLIAVETGEVLIHTSAEGIMAEYKDITQSITGAILESFGLENMYKPKVATSSKEDEVVLSTFSGAIDDYDNGEDDKALAKLQEASKIDKTNKAVKQYLSKLNIISPKFQFEDPPWQSSYNPAASAMLDKRLLYVRSTFHELGQYSDTDNMKNSGHEDEPIFRIGDDLNPTYLQGAFSGFNARVGYNFPVGERIGINTELTVDELNEGSEIVNGFIYDSGELYDVPVIIDGKQVFLANRYSPNVVYYSLTGGVAYQFIDTMSAGLNGSIIIPILNGQDYHDGGVIGSGDSIDDRGHLFANADQTEVYAVEEKIGYVINPGIAGSFFSNRLYTDLSLAYVFLPRYYYDYDKDAYVNGTYPVYTSLSINGSLIENLLFLGSKIDCNIYKDSDAKGAYFKGTLVSEIWPVKYLSIRGGYTYSFFDIDGRTTQGDGFLAGVTLSLAGFNFDFNYTLRQAPYDSIEGVLIPIRTLFFSLSYNEFWPKRK